MHHNKLISQLSNKTKTAWNVIRSLTKKQSNTKDEFILNIEGTQIKNPQILADSFNDYFSKTVDESVCNITKQTSSKPNNIPIWNIWYKNFSNHSHQLN
jgi:hypothetical protein